MAELSYWSRILCMTLLGWGICFGMVQAENPPPPKEAQEILRHDQHVLLIYGDLEKGYLPSYLISRQSTLEKPVALQPEDLAYFQDLKAHFQGQHPLPLDTVLFICHLAYQKLVRLYAYELEEFSQLTIVPGPDLWGLPFEAFILSDNPRSAAHRFMTEVWSISYLSGFQVQERSQTQLLPRWDSGKRIFPPGMRKRFLDLIAKGAYTDEALGLSRSYYLDSLRKHSGPLDPAQDPKHWASVMVVGDIAPLRPPYAFPWWILVPVGLLMVIAFGKRL